MVMLLSFYPSQALESSRVLSRIWRVAYFKEAQVASFNIADLWRDLPLMSQRLLLFCFLNIDCRNTVPSGD